MSAVQTERLHRDVHPAEMLLPSGTLVRDLRVFVTSKRLLAFVARNGRIEQALELEVAQPCSVPRDRGTLRGSLEVRLADGSTVWVNRGQGCGCHSMLKTLGQPVGWTFDPP